MRRPLRLLGACLCASGVLWALGLAYGQDAIPFAAPPGQQALASAGGEETTPITIFGLSGSGGKLVSWYRADLGVTGSSPVTAWADSSGNGHNLTASGTPELVTDGGDSAIDFEAGDSDYFFRTLTGEPTDEPLAVYLVAQRESEASDHNMFAISTAATSNSRWVCQWANAGDAARAVTVDSAGGSALAPHAGDLPLNTRHLFYYDFESDTDRSVNVDETTEVTNTTSATVGTPNRVSVGSGRGDAANGPHDGLIFEVVLLNAKPSAGEADAYLAYADARFDIPGITSTPPLGPSDPYRWPLVLLAAGLAVLVASLRRRPASRTPEAPAPASYALDEAAPGLPMTHDLDEVLRMRAAIETFHWQEVDARRARTLRSVAEAGRRAARRAA